MIDTDRKVIAAIVIYARVSRASLPRLDRVSDNLAY